MSTATRAADPGHLRASIRLNNDLSPGAFAELAHVAPICRWTSGAWDGLGDAPVPWNALQNTPRDVSALSNLLIRTYVTARTGR